MDVAQSKRYFPLYTLEPPCVLESMCAVVRGSEYLHLSEQGADFVCEYEPLILKLQAMLFKEYRKECLYRGVSSFCSSRTHFTGLLVLPMRWALEWASSCANTGTNGYLVPADTLLWQWYPNMPTARLWPLETFKPNHVCSASGRTVTQETGEESWGMASPRPVGWGLQDTGTQKYLHWRLPRVLGTPRQREGKHKDYLDRDFRERERGPQDREGFQCLLDYI